MSEYRTGEDLKRLNDMIRDAELRPTVVELGGQERIEQRVLHMVADLTHRVGPELLSLLQISHSIYADRPHIRLHFCLDTWEHLAYTHPDLQRSNVWELWLDDTVESGSDSQGTWRVRPPRSAVRGIACEQFTADTLLLLIGDWRMGRLGEHEVGTYPRYMRDGILDHHTDG